MKKIIENIFVGFGLIFLIWISASYLEVVIKNLGENPQYSFLNLFDILINLKI